MIGGMFSVMMMYSRMKQGIVCYLVLNVEIELHVMSKIFNPFVLKLNISCKQALSFGIRVIGLGLVLFSDNSAT